MSDWDARIADDEDPLRRILEVARAWHVAPSQFMGDPVITTYSYDHAGRMVRAETVQWTAEDRDAAFALANYEADLCPGCNHPLSETTKIEHTAAYRPDQAIRCHYCTTQAALTKTQSEDDDTSAGLLYPIQLDAEIVKLNLQPVPPLPPELGG